MKGILFKPDMYRAVVEGRKSMTRRIIKNKSGCFLIGTDEDGIHRTSVKPKYQIGEVVYVKEPYFYGGPFGYTRYWYKWSETWKVIEQMTIASFKWKSPLFMPESAARLFIKITDIKVERVSGISEEDAVREGVECFSDIAGWRDYQHGQGWYKAAKYSFKSLWASINGSESWERGDWVWCYSFEKVNKPI
jgi:hypothetical protein